MISATDALPMTLRPSRDRTALLLLIFVAFTVLGIIMGRDGEWPGYLIGGFFALGIPVVALRGSGYASFVEAWFYPADGSARQSRRGEDHMGLVVLFSRLSRFFVLGEDEKTWSDDGSGSGGLPNFRSVDEIAHPAILPHIAPVTAPLTAAGLRRLRRQDLAAFLPETCPVPAILTAPPFRQFDALFHWED